MIKKCLFSIFLHNITCCGCVLSEAILIHIDNICFYGELMVIKVRTLLQYCLFVNKGPRMVYIEDCLQKRLD